MTLLTYQCPKCKEFFYLEYNSGPKPTIHCGNCDQLLTLITTQDTPDSRLEKPGNFEQL